MIGSVRNTFRLSLPPPRADSGAYPPYYYGGGAGGMIGCSVRYQAELLGLWDPQNRDLRRKSPPETEKSVGLLSPPLEWGVLISVQI